MGDKVSAKKAMIEAGVPCVPGSGGALPEDPKEIIRIAREVGYPVIIKASGGGGGRGMRVVHTEAALISAVNTTRMEAKAAFGNGTVYLENTWKIRATSRFRFWRTTSAMPFGLAKETAPFKEEIKRLLKKHRQSAFPEEMSKNSVNAVLRPAEKSVIAVPVHSNFFTRTASFISLR